MPYTAVESFSGPGGLSLGLRLAGFDLRFAFDSNIRAVETYARNLAPHVEALDAEKVSAELVARAGRITGQRLDLFSGGPPCQGFSKQKRGAHLGDERNTLVLEFARLVKDLDPRFFLLENVAMFGQKRGRSFLDRIHRMLPKYEFFPHFYNCADFGLAQTRKRFILVGKHQDVGAPFWIQQHQLFDAGVRSERRLAIFPSRPQTSPHMRTFPTISERVSPRRT